MVNVSDQELHQAIDLLTSAGYRVVPPRVGERGVREATPGVNPGAAEVRPAGNDVSPSPVRDGPWPLVGAIGGGEQDAIPSNILVLPGSSVPAPTDLTVRQLRILEFVRSWIQEHGYTPSVREIGEAVGLVSTSSVARQLQALERRGYLRRDPNRPRAVTVRPAEGPTGEEAIKDQRPTPAYVPVLGRVAAGGPILAEQSVQDVFPLPSDLVGEGVLFLLQVKGDSMIDAAICDGDWVVVRQQPTARDGEIVAAMIDGEATIKTYRRRDGSIWLTPHNDAFPPISGDTATILGVVVALLRRM